MILLAMPSEVMAQAPMRSTGNQSAARAGNAGAGKGSSSSDDEDPCIDPDDQRHCWTQDPITGIRYEQVPDTSHINLGNRQTMAGKSLGLVHTGNLYSPHIVQSMFDRINPHDYMFVNAYQLFAYRPEDMLFYDTRIPFTNVSYFTSGTSTQSNDRLRINFAGNIKSNIGIGTSLDYVYARGEYISQATKPLKWSSYLYYTDDLYKATLTYNISKLANQENGGIEDRDYILRPDAYGEIKNLTDPHTMPVNLSGVWNDMDSYNLHFNHSYDLGHWDEQYNPEDSTDVWDEFTSVASIFHSIDLESYDRTFIMDPQTVSEGQKPFFKNHYYDPTSTADSSSYLSFSTYAGMRINEGFSRWSQFGLSAFIGYQHQSYAMKDSLPPLIDPEKRDTIRQFGTVRHKSDNIFIGGQLSRHQSRFLTFDVTAKFGIWGDKQFDIDIDGHLQTIIPAGSKDSITVQASGYFRNQHVSYMLEHYFSNHFKWDNELKPEQRMHLQGNFHYSLTGTDIRIGLDHLSNYHYFRSPDFLPIESENMIEVISAEISQKLHWKAIHFDNRLLLQKSNHNEELPLPNFVWESDLSLRFVIAHTLTTQLGCTAYYTPKYYAPTYQPATQQFAVQSDYECGGYPLFNAYVNCNLKRIKFYIMYSGFGTNAFTNNVFMMPNYSLQSPRLEYGVVFDLQD